MENKQIDGFFNELQIKLTRIYLLTIYFEKMSAEETERCKQRVVEYRKEYNNGIFEKVPKLGYRTVNDFKQLEKDDQELYTEYFRQLGLDGAISNNMGFIKSNETFIPEIFWSSVFVSVFSHFEFYLKDSCILIANISNGHFNQNKDSIIDASKNFLSQMECYDFSKSRDWSAIKDFQKIRNVIVHNQAMFHHDNSKKTRHLKKKYCSLFQGNSESIILNKMFVEEAVMSISNFFKILHEKIKLEMKQR